MSIKPNFTDNSDSPIGCPAPPPEINNNNNDSRASEKEMREVLGDTIYEMSASSPDPIGGKTHENTTVDTSKINSDADEDDSDNENTLTASYSGSIPASVSTLEMQIEEFLNMDDEEIEVQFGEIKQTSAFFPPSITDRINYVSKKHLIGKKKSGAYITTSGVTYINSYLETPILKAVETDEDLFRYIRECVEANPMSPVHIKSASTSIKNITITRDGESTKRTPVYICENTRGYIANVCDYHRLQEVDCLRLSSCIAIVKSTIFSKEAKIIANREIELILNELIKTASNASRERCAFYIQNKQYLNAENKEYIENQMKCIDEIFGVPHCKYCLSNDTKLERKGTDKRKAQYRCQEPNCGRLFTPKPNK